tara:strand:- start:70854 stop:71420 length:567 start_codon:yes stop_codon:yes gene_type:complete
MKIYKVLIISLALSSQPIWAKSDGPFEKIGEKLDKTIESTVDYTYIVSELANDPLLNPLDIKVKIEGDTAILNGIVATDIQYDRAITIVSSLNKIEDVNTENFKIEKSQSVIDDMATTAKIKGKLIKLKFVNGLDTSLWPLKIETKNGKVFLTGEIKSNADSLEIQKVIRSTKGVSSVHFDIKIVGKE